MIARGCGCVSLRSRRRKLRLFLELIQPTAETTVVDVGVTDAPSARAGQALTHNFFEALYPWPERITAVGHTCARPLRARRSRRSARVGADGRDLPFADGEFDLGFSNAVVEHVAAAATGSERFVARALPGREAGLRDDAEPALPARPAHAAAVRALAPATAARLLGSARRRARPARPAGARARSSRTRCGSSTPASPDRSRRSISEREMKKTRPAGL